jgi:uridine kinase
MTPERERCLEKLAGLIQPHEYRTTLVAIDGPDAAGKTTLADELARLLERRAVHVVRASIDGFHRPRAERLARGPESPEGYYRDSFDYPALWAALLDPLRPGGNLKFRRRVFDYRTDSPVSAPLETADKETVLLFDGVFLLRPELASVWDFTVFIDVPFEETMRRAAQRDAALFGSAEETMRRYSARYVPGQELYFREARPKERADVIVDNANPGRPTLQFRRRLDS